MEIEGPIDGLLVKFSCKQIISFTHARHFERLPGIHSESGTYKNEVHPRAIFELNCAYYDRKTGLGLGLGPDRLCSATFEQLLAFGATFSNFSNLEQLLAF